MTRQAQADQALTGLYDSYRCNLGRCSTSPEASEAADQAYLAYWADIDQMTATPAETLAGLIAKAKVIKEYFIPSLGAEGLIVSLVDDCIRMGGVA